MFNIIHILMIILAFENANNWQDQEDVVEETGIAGCVNPKSVKWVSQKKVRAKPILNLTNSNSWQRGVMFQQEQKLPSAFQEQVI